MRAFFRVILAVFLLCSSIAVPTMLASTPPDSLITMLQRQSARNDKLDLMKTYQEKGQHYFEAGELSSAMENFQLALAIAEEMDNKEEIAQNLFSIGRAHEKLNNYQFALDYYLRYLEMGKSFLAENAQSYAISKIAYVYRSLGDFEKAYDYQLRALQINENLGDSTGMMRSLYQIGSIFFYQERYEQALAYYEKSLAMCVQLNNLPFMYAFQGAIGSVYEKLNNFQKALDYYFQSLQIAQKLKSKASIGYALHNVGSGLLSQRKYREALTYFNRSLKIKEETQDRMGQIGTLNSLSDCYSKLGDYKNAIRYLNKAKAFANALGAKVRLLEVYSYYAKTYESAGDYKNAFKNLQEYKSLKDSILNETTLQEMGTRKSQFEIQKRESKISLLKKENELLEKNKQIKALYNYLGIGTALFLLLISGVLFSRYKVQRQSNQLLEEKNAQIHVQNKLLETSNEELKSFAYVASHDLREPLRMIKSYTDLLERRYRELFDKNAREFMFFITDAVGRMDTLLVDLLSFSRAGTQTPSFEPVATSNIVEIVAATLKLKIEEEKAKLIFQPEDLPEIMGCKSQMIQLFQNLISNALKFQGDKKPEVSVGCRKNGKNYIFNISDNGIGIAPENKEKIFEVFRRLHTREEFEGTGIGLATCKRIVQKHGGDIWVESELGQGCTFYFTIPYPN